MSSGVCDSRHSDDALPIGLPQSDYLAPSPDYVYGSHQRIAHCLSCIRFCARWSNCVTADHPTTLRGFRSMQLADCVWIYFLSDRRSNHPHSAVRANASQTVRLITCTFLAYNYICRAKDLCNENWHMPAKHQLRHASVCLNLVQFAYCLSAYCVFCIPKPKHKIRIFAAVQLDTLNQSRSLRQRFHIGKACFGTDVALDACTGTNIKVAHHCC